MAVVPAAATAGTLARLGYYGLRYGVPAVRAGMKAAPYIWAGRQYYKAGKKMFGKRKPPKRKNKNMRYKIMAGDIQNPTRRRYGPKQKLRKLGVGAQNDHIVVDSTINRLSGLSSKSHWAFVSSTIGLNSGTMYNKIYSAEGFADVDTSVVIRQQITNYYLRNASDTPCKLTLYTLRLKRPLDSARPPNTVMLELMSNMGITLSSTYNAPINVSPFDNPQFGYYFQKKGQKTYNLRPGDQITHSISSKAVFKRSFQYRNESTHSYLAGTYLMLARLEGVIVHDSTNKTTEIGTTAPVIDCIIAAKMKYRIPDGTDAAKFSSIAATTVTSFTNAGVGLLDADLAVTGAET